MSLGFIFFHLILHRSKCLWCFVRGRISGIFDGAKSTLMSTPTTRSAAVFTCIVAAFYNLRRKYLQAHSWLYTYKDLRKVPWPLAFLRLKFWLFILIRKKKGFVLKFIVLIFCLGRFFRILYFFVDKKRCCFALR